MKRDQTFNLRMGSADRKRLNALAKHYAAPAATAVRVLIKLEYDRLRKLGAHLDGRRS